MNSVGAHEQTARDAVLIFFFLNPQPPASNDYKTAIANLRQHLASIAKSQPRQHPAWIAAVLRVAVDVCDFFLQRFDARSHRGRTHLKKHHALFFPPHLSPQHYNQHGVGKHIISDWLTFHQECVRIAQDSCVKVAQHQLPQRHSNVRPFYFNVFLFFSLLFPVRHSAAVGI
jgi:hypothetical protein